MDKEVFLQDKRGEQGRREKDEHVLLGEQIVTKASHHIIRIEERIVDADNLDLRMSGGDAGDEATDATKAVNTNVDGTRHERYAVLQRQD